MAEKGSPSEWANASIEKARASADLCLCQYIVPTKPSPKMENTIGIRKGIITPVIITLDFVKQM